MPMPMPGTRVSGITVESIRMMLRMATSGLQTASSTTATTQTNTRMAIGDRNRKREPKSNPAIPEMASCVNESGISFSRYDDWIIINLAVSGSRSGPAAVSLPVCPSSSQRTSPVIGGLEYCCLENREWVPRSVRLAMTPRILASTLRMC